jgi:hypothetical protein
MNESDIGSPSFALQDHTLQRERHDQRRESKFISISPARTTN